VSLLANLRALAAKWLQVVSAGVVELLLLGAFWMSHHESNLPFPAGNVNKPLVVGYFEKSFAIGG